MGSEQYLVRIDASMKIDIDLYRGGNATSPRFDNVRDKDVVKIKDPTSGLIKVKGMSGGISTFKTGIQNWGQVAKLGSGWTYLVLLSRYAKQQRTSTTLLARRLG